MNHRKILTYALWILAAAGAVALLYLLFRPVAPQPRTSSANTAAQPCSTDADPCIKLVDKAGRTVAKFNDFRFIAGTNCIYYRDPPPAWVKYCGGTMLWIGPDPTTKTSLQ